MDEETAQFDVACHVAGCENDGIVIAVTAPLIDPIVVCGPCGTLINQVSIITD